MAEASGASQRWSICVVTPTKNRHKLIQRLYESLALQTDTDFTWLVVDDGGSDATLPWLQSQVESAPFPVNILVNHTNRGKCSCLNRAFAHLEADFYLVVDSDDRLLPDAIEIVRTKLARVYEDRSIGAIFFGYLGHDALPIGLPSDNRDIVMYRSEMDGSRGKYDGCVGYTSSVVSTLRYPEFEAETYVGDTVLQLLMEPTYKILFAGDVIGVAEYQLNGLTAAGRALRLRNPLGMMCYARLCAATAVTTKQRVKYRITYWAYEKAQCRPPSAAELEALRPQPPAGVYKACGRMLAAYWQSRATT